jgi:flagellar biosynthesis protein FliQ
MNTHVVRTDRRTASESPWLPLWIALAALLATPVVGLLMRIVRAVLDSRTWAGGFSPGMIGVAATVLVAGAGVWVALRDLRRGTRSWPVWTGLVVSGLVLLFWVAFSVAEIASPH